MEQPKKKYNIDKINQYIKELNEISRNLKNGKYPKNNDGQKNTSHGYRFDIEPPNNNKYSASSINKTNNSSGLAPYTPPFNPPFAPGLKLGRQGGLAPYTPPFNPPFAPGLKLGRQGGIHDEQVSSGKKISSINSNIKVLPGVIKETTPSNSITKQNSHIQQQNIKCKIDTSAAITYMRELVNNIIANNVVDFYDDDIKEFNKLCISTCDEIIKYLISNEIIILDTSYAGQYKTKPYIKTLNMSPNDYVKKKRRVMSDHICNFELFYKYISICYKKLINKYFNTKTNAENFYKISIIQDVYKKFYFIRIFDENIFVEEFFNSIKLNKRSDRYIILDGPSVTEKKTTETTVIPEQKNSSSAATVPVPVVETATTVVKPATTVVETATTVVKPVTATVPVVKPPTVATTVVVTEPLANTQPSTTAASEPAATKPTATAVSVATVPTTSDTKIEPTQPTEKTINTPLEVINISSAFYFGWYTSNYLINIKYTTCTHADTNPHGIDKKQVSKVITEHTTHINTIIHKLCNNSGELSIDDIKMLVYILCSYIHSILFIIITHHLEYNYTHVINYIVNSINNQTIMDEVAKNLEDNTFKPLYDKILDKIEQINIFYSTTHSILKIITMPNNEKPMKLIEKKKATETEIELPQFITFDYFNNYVELKRLLRFINENHVPAPNKGNNFSCSMLNLKYIYNININIKFYNKYTNINLIHLQILCICLKNIFVFINMDTGRDYTNVINYIITIFNNNNNITNNIDKYFTDIYDEYAVVINLLYKRNIRIHLIDFKNVFKYINDYIMYAIKTNAETPTDNTNKLYMYDITTPYNYKTVYGLINCINTFMNLIDINETTKKYMKEILNHYIQYLQYIDNNRNNKKLNVCITNVGDNLSNGIERMKNIKEINEIIEEMKIIKETATKVEPDPIIKSDINVKTNDTIKKNDEIKETATKSAAIPVMKAIKAIDAIKAIEPETLKLTETTETTHESKSATKAIATNTSHTAIEANITSKSAAMPVTTKVNENVIPIKTIIKTIESNYKSYLIYPINITIDEYVFYFLNIYNYLIQHKNTDTRNHLIHILYMNAELCLLGMLHTQKKKANFDNIQKIANALNDVLKDANIIKYIKQKKDNLLCHTMIIKYICDINNKYNKNIIINIIDFKDECDSLNLLLTTHRTDHRTDHRTIPTILDIKFYNMLEYIKNMCICDGTINYILNILNALFETLIALITKNSKLIVNKKLVDNNFFNGFISKHIMPTIQAIITKYKDEKINNSDFNTFVDKYNTEINIYGKLAAISITPIYTIYYKYIKEQQTIFNTKSDKIYNTYKINKDELNIKIENMYGQLQRLIFDFNNAHSIFIESYGIRPKTYASVQNANKIQILNHIKITPQDITDCETHYRTVQQHLNITMADYILDLLIQEINMKKDKNIFIDTVKTMLNNAAYLTDTIKNYIINKINSKYNIRKKKKNTDVVKDNTILPVSSENKRWSDIPHIQKKKKNN